MITVVGFALLLGCTLAEPGSPKLSDIEIAYVSSAVTWDRNKDGQVTRDEWSDYLLELLKLSDKNKDGKLTPAEFASSSSVDRLFSVADFTYFDVNKDGVVDRGELVGKPNPGFQLLDKDNNCTLTTEELAAARQLRRPGPSMSPGERGKGGPPGERKR
jgi:hypothetical protein